MQRNRRFYPKKKKGKSNQGKSPYAPENKKSSDVKSLETQSGHGFQEFRSAKAMTKYLSTDPDKELIAEFQPELFGRKKPNKKDLDASGGHN